jgi:serine/threonine-protein kinase
MDSKRWAEIKELLGEILAIEDAKSRATLLEQRCAGDAALRAEVETFLHYEEKTEVFLEVPALDLLEGASPERREGEQLGAYRLEGVIAQGGMGVVHRASRVDGTYRQEVAVKVLKRGLDTAAVVRRFQRERQILANLTHPHVVRVVDGGATTDGLPYYVMEYVDGLPIDRFCEAHRLEIRDRMALFRQVCLAAHSAHQELVVHCDLKPSNVLVVTDGTPRLVDFGIARLLRAEGEATLLTGPQPVTWGYASPEQLDGKKPTTASDIYSLGALLYRLLTGVAPPKDPPETGLRPSRVPQDGPTLVEGLERKHLRGDPDIIVRKATAPDPAQRYASAAELAEDVERYLDHRPLRARRAGVLYPVGRFLQRHRWQSAVAAGVLGVLVYFGSQWQGSLLRANALQSFVLAFLSAVDPTAPEKNSEAVKAAVETAEAAPIRMQDYDYSLVLDRLGRMLLRSGDEETAQELLERALAIRRRIPDSELLVGESLNNLATVHLRRGNLTKARDLLDEAYAIHQQQGRPGASLEILENVATALENAGEFGQAERSYREVLAGKEQVFGQGSEPYANTLNNLGQFLDNRGRLKEGIPMLEEALRIRRRELGPKHQKVGTTLVNLAYARDQEGDHASAIPLFQEALTIRRQLHDEDTVEVVGVKAALAYTLLGRNEGNDLKEAERLFRQAEKVFADRYGAGTRGPLTIRRNLAATLLAQGRAAEALEITQAALAAQPGWTEGHWRQADLESVHGAALAEQGRLAEAEPLLVAAVPIIAASQGEDSRYTREARARLDRLRQLQERLPS